MVLLARFKAESEASMEDSLAKLRSTVCFLKFGVLKSGASGDNAVEPIGRVIIELFGKLAPRVSTHSLF